jgi:short subunit dehydrogenase-like uncharacterized protein
LLQVIPIQEDDRVGDNSSHHAEIVTSGLDKQSVNDLVKKTTVLINTVGPYMLYAEPVVEACARNGTHYLDVTGETPWVREMIKKYHATAKANKAIIIHQIGVESAPADLLSWSMVNHARRTLSAGVSELVFSVADLKGQPSGGTLATVIGLFDKYSIAETTEAMKPWSLCPTTPPRSSLEGPTLLQKLFGVRQVRDLGTLSTSIQGAADATIVHRSWGLFENGGFYGPKFRFSPYMHVRNTFTGILVHFALAVGMIALIRVPAWRGTLEGVLSSRQNRVPRHCYCRFCRSQRSQAHYWTYGLGR